LVKKKEKRMVGVVVGVGGGGGGGQYEVPFIVSLTFEYVHIHGIYRVNLPEYVIRILVAASQEYVDTYSTRRVLCQRLNTSRFWLTRAGRVNPKH